MSQTISFLAQSDVRTFYENVPLLPLTSWLQGAAFVLAVGLLIAYVIWMYSRDAADLPRGLAVLLATLRVAAFAALILFFLNPEKRSETEISKDSRAAVLIDTSLSMGLTDPDDSASVIDDLPRRIDHVIQTLKTTDVIERISEKHEVTIYRFGEESQPEAIATFPKKSSQAAEQNSDSNNVAVFERSLLLSRRVALAAFCCLIGSIVLTIPFLLFLRNSERREIRSWILAGALLCFVATIALVGIADLISNQFDLLTSLGLKQPTELSSQVTNEPANDSTVDQIAAPELIDPKQVDWSKLLNPNGTATRLGETLQQIVNRERGGPIAGIVLVTDGRNNAGQDPQRALTSAVDAGIPIYPIGAGSDREVQNVRVTDIQVPPRAFPNDKFKVKGIVQATGLEGQTVHVKLISTDTEDQEAELVEEETDIRLLKGGQPSAVEFEVSRQQEGKRKYIVRVDAPPRDLDNRDNQREAIVEIIERRSKVLLVVGGPTRDYRFLRNQLYRDDNVESHVWLQTAKDGADQESDTMLEDFPRNREEMYQYDCIVAFDPDWRALSPEQVNILEKWVAEQAGGMIIIAGAVNTPEWTRAERGNEVIDIIRRLYPVSFYSQGSARLKLGRFGGSEAFPLQFTREGRAAEYLWLGETATDSQIAWEQWEGVFGYYAVNEPKAAASILANFSDPSTEIEGDLPIYLASQYYGAGRVFFQASGEMWRIRELDVNYFQDYYTQLIRWASQGRLLRDSTRGVLLTDRDRCWVGDQVSVQAILRDDQDQPLALKSVEATLLGPDGNIQQLDLQSSDQAVRPGTFTGNFLAPTEGDFRVSLLIPGSSELETLSKTVRASIPDREKEQPQRNDALLTELAEKTNGYYFPTIKQATAPEGEWMKIEAMIQPQDQKHICQVRLIVNLPSG